MILDFSNLSVKHRKQLNNISVEIHNDFNKLTEDILNATRKNIADLVSNVVSRHPYQSPLYKVCYSLVFVDRLNKTEKIDLIITNDYDVLKVIKKHFPLIPVKFNGDFNIKQKIKNRFKLTIDLLRIIVNIYREVKSKSSKRINKIKELKTLILIDTFFLKTTIERKKYVPRYYTGMLNFIDEKTKTKIYYTPQILAKYSRKDLEEIIDNSEENILYKQDFLRISDYFEIIILLAKHKVSKQKKLFFKNFDLTDYILEQSRKSRFGGSSFAALKNYFFIKRLKSNKVNLKLVIDWNENQPIDKGLIKAVHNFYPEVKVKGYRGFIISHDYNLYLSPTSYEVENGVIPDEIDVIGNGLIAETKRFYNKINVSLAPAFRFMDIYTPIKTVKEEKILVALPIGIDDSVDILKILSEASRNHLANQNHFLIKPHPSFKIEKVKNMLGSAWLSNFEPVGGALKENLIRSSLFISNTSTAILESLAYGIPGIIIAGKNTIVQNPIPSSVNHKIWKLVYTPEELAEAINFYMSTSEEDKEEYHRIGDEVKEAVFEEISPEKVYSFLNE